ncbi:MAG TPA: hypothetical protein VLD36_01030 [Burkholderiales bacterium]|nr:hypothetical protein [Burkholderiales bacterium]
MDRARVLAGLNRRILGTFSRRTVAALRAHLPVRLALSHLEWVLVMNVAKEVRKDSLVIRAAGDALAAGSPPGREALHKLLEAAKGIDQAFLDRIGVLPVRVAIRYEDVVPVRAERMERLLGAGYRILDAWQTEPGLRGALRASYPKPELERLLYDILRLYALETHALSRSVRLPALLTPLRERLAGSVYGVMNDAAARLANDLARVV